MGVPSQPGSGPRLNKWPAVIGIGLFVVFMVGMFYAAQQRSQKVVESSEPESVFDFGETNATVDFLEGKPDGLVGVDRNPIGESPPDVDESDGYEDDIATWLRDRELNKLKEQSERRDRMASKQLEEYENAMRASSAVPGFEPREPDEPARPEVIVPASAPGTDPIASLLASLGAAGDSGVGGGGATSIDPASLGKLLSTPEAQALVQRFAGGGSGGTGSVITPGAGGSTDSTGVQANRAFVGAQTVRDDEFVLQARSRPPRSPYEVKTGAIIPGAMISAASSELPGDILAQVTQDVYDTASGRYVVVPQGTKIFGRYDAYTALGQERLLIVWNRLVFPDGETLDIGGMQGYDDRGLSGFKDRVNTHFLRTLANALLISVVNASGAALVESVSEPDTSVFNLNLAQDFTDTTSTAFNEYLSNRLRIRPTLDIRSGYKFNIIVSKDIDFDGPYERGFAAYRVGQ